MGGFLEAVGALGTQPQGHTFLQQRTSGPASQKKTLQVQAPEDTEPLAPGTLGIPEGLGKTGVCVSGVV